MPGFERRSKKESSFLKKRSRKLLAVVRAWPAAHAKVAKVFWFFFSKKNCFVLAVYEPASRAIETTRQHNTSKIFHFFGGTGLPRNETAV
jgi:hypothetical protein